MILEVHGDVCRLGYLKVVACLLEDGVPRSPDYLASLLLETCRSAENDVGGLLGLLRTEVNAVNYVKLASQLGFYDRATGRLGGFGAAYVCLSASSPIKMHVTGEQPAKLSEMLGLNDVERLLFLHALLSADFPMISNVLRWVYRKREFSRHEAMEVVMEEIYPEALRRVLKKSDGRKRELIVKELENSLRFREERLKYGSKVEWIRSRLYAKYRHTVPPRLEWLSDVGLVWNRGRGRYGVSEWFLQNFRDLDVVLQRSVERLDQTFFGDFVQSVVPLRLAGRRVEVQFLTECYRVLQRVLEKVRLDVLCLATSYRMVEAGYRSSPASVSRIFSHLSQRYPDKVFAYDSDDGSPEVTGVDISLLNNLTLV